jgi:hypothetical protein
MIVISVSSSFSPLRLSQLAAAQGIELNIAFKTTGTNRQISFMAFPFRSLGRG